MRAHTLIVHGLLPPHQRWNAIAPAWPVDRGDTGARGDQRKAGALGPERKSVLWRKGNAAGVAQGFEDA